ncbi:MAG: hypothetical protein JO151_01000 [Verrucomicrobia bacterium]|jgi:hypothetical protein|nr:hypothetical protein [Verrucomicrobiota bacterium]
MNTSSDASQKAPKIHVHIVDVVEQKGEGYTVILQAFPDAEVTSHETWRVVLPGDFRGATKVGRLWHLYYGKDPGYSAGASLDIDLPRQGDNT